MLLFLSTLFICRCNGKAKQYVSTSVPIRQLNFLSWTDSAKTSSGFRIAKFDYFLVKGDGFDSGEIRIGIDRFARDLAQKEPCHCAQWDMLFFKETGKTNEAELKKDKDLIDTYSTKHDLIWMYDWSYDHLISTLQYSDGLIINPKSSIYIQNMDHSTHPKAVH